MSREDKGPDCEFSLEPGELEKLCIDSNQAWLALGESGYAQKPAEEENIKFRRSIYAVKNIKSGEKFTKENIRRIRPGYGIAPKHYDSILGKLAAVDVNAGMPLDWDLIDSNK